MTSTSNGASCNAPKRIPSVLEEAQQLMDELEASNELSESLVIDGFAIDSDDEDEDMREDRVGATAEQKQPPPPAAAATASASSSSSTPKTLLRMNTSLSSTFNDNETITSIHTSTSTSTAPLVAEKQNVHAPPLHPLQEHLVMIAPAPSTTTTGSPSSSHQFDFKTKTTQFASNLASNASTLANLAQKAASQAVAAAMDTAITPQSGGASILPSTSSMQSQQQHHQYHQTEQLLHPHVELDNDQKLALIATHIGSLLPGERVIMFLSNLLYISDSTFGEFPFDTMWCCCMTYYRLLLFCTTTSSLQQSHQPTPAEWNPHCWTLPQPPTLLQMPLASMEKVEKSIYSTGGGSSSSSPTMMGLIIYGKDNSRWLKFTAPSYADTLKAHEALQTYAFPGRRNLGYLFAFESKRQSVMDSLDEKKQVTLPPTRKRFDALVEFKRQFRSLQVWTCWTMINQQYQLCSSYPSIIAGPSSLSENNPEMVRIIRGTASFRSEGRLPVLTWSCGVDGASLWRASQPKVGLQGNRSTADELYVKHVAESCMTTNALLDHKPTTMPTRQQLVHLTGSSSLQGWILESNCQLKILDLRPKSSAMANRTGGYGYENTSYYTGTTIQFCNIGNIHAIRDSYNKMSALCLNSTTSDVQFGSLLEDTKWLSYLRLILAASWEAAYWIHVYRMPVLLHCSHGWDRTSQVAVLSQLLLDPYYRTREGFSTLVEKDFMCFGHPFHTRSGHGEGRGDKDTPNGSSGDEGQISPIFIQFLDCVYQIVHQYPECFEFNTKYLLVLSEHVYSCRFGTMLCDTERERELVAGIRQRTHSLWDYLDSRQDLISPNYKEGGILLMPLPTLMRNVTLWADRHCMYSPKATLRSLPTYLEQPTPVLENDQQGPLNMADDYLTLNVEYEKRKAKSEV